MNCACVTAVRERARCFLEIKSKAMGDSPPEQERGFNAAQDTREESNTTGGEILLGKRMLCDEP